MKQAAWTMVLATALAAAFWDPLARGGGFVGGDVYSYYFPQKTFYAECLKNGEWPLWNPLAGHGYPVLGESQTGAFYPPHLLLYRLFSVHAAYHLNHGLHYALALGFMALLARRLGLSFASALFAGVVFTYSWFPVRSCWEWAIVGGAWLPLAVWLADRLFAANRAIDAIGLSAALGAQMLAGHYQIAFLTQLTVLGWLAWKSFLARSASPAGVPAAKPRFLTRGLALGTLSLLGGFALAAVQWLPTAELMRHSQRSELGELHNPARGRTPWRSLTHLAGWIVQEEPTGVADRVEPRWTPWCSPLARRDEMLQKWSAPVPTNQMEASLYFGLIPLGLAVVGAGVVLRERRSPLRFWVGLAAVALVYSTGALLPWLQRLPGFGWFHGPGRWGVLLSLSAGMLCGAGLDRLKRACPRWLAVAFSVWMLFSVGTLSAVVSDAEFVAQETAVPTALRFLGLEWGVEAMDIAAAFLLTLVAAGLWKNSRAIAGPRGGGGLLVAGFLATTLLDFGIASRLVTYAPMTLDPPLRHLDESPVRKALLEEASGQTGRVRLWAPGGNLPTILGVASTPPYFTFGPKEYTEPLPLPDVPKGLPPRNAESAARLRRNRMGVTHLLSFEKLDPSRKDVMLLWEGIDPFLNPAWARFREPVFLYRVNEASGRLRWEGRTDEAASATLTAFRPNEVSIDVASETGGRLVLTDLLFPGWNVDIDGTPAMAFRADGMFRAVDVPAGSHRVSWTYRPRSVYWGAASSLLAALAMVGGLVGVSLPAWRKRRAASSLPGTP